MSDLDTKEYIELLRLRAVNKALLEALQTITEQFADVMIGPLGEGFTARDKSVPTILKARAAIAHAKDQQT